MTERHQPERRSEDRMAHQALEVAGHYFDKWTKRLLAIATLLAMVFGAMLALGWRSPSELARETGVRLGVVEDSVHVFSGRFDGMRHDMLTNTVLSCELLHRQSVDSVEMPECLEARARLQIGAP